MGEPAVTRAETPRSDVMERYLLDERVQRLRPRLAELAGEIARGERVVSNLRCGEHAYVDLVVEGGGVLGIALVGYTWALEQAGLRFRHIGGASAGAIVALLLASLGPKEEAKSERIVAELARFDLGTLEDGDIPSRVFKFLRRAGFTGRAVAAGGLAAALFGPVVLGSLLGLPIGAWLLLGWAAIVGLLVALVLVVLRRRGVNSGSSFTAWMSAVLLDHGVATLPRLRELLQSPPPAASDPGATRWQADLRLIASELAGERKVVLPADTDLYWARPDEVNPAELLRASMSIPFFFQPYRVEGPPEEVVPVGGEPGRVRHPIFVDGGLVSNFPIAEFHRDDGAPPDAPTFGVRLLSLAKRERETRPQPPDSVFRFIAALFNTARFALDRSFIAQNPEYARLVQVVDTDTHDWLAFDLSLDDQVDLFCRGVEAAAAFLEGFDWPAYLEVRKQLDGPRRTMMAEQRRVGHSSLRWLGEK